MNVRERSGGGGQATRIPGAVSGPKGEGNAPKPISNSIAVRPKPGGRTKIKGAVSG